VSRTTIDYGIDLGTTNSSIAVASGTGTEILKNNLEADITPSAVYINRNGNLWVGHSARSKIGDERAEGDLHLEFKRRMGTGFEYAFRASGRRMRPEDLSAEVLKSLRGDVAQKRNEQISAAVITVPAAFELHQCEATKRAAELAGFRTALLLQEPVAAALAYGFQRVEAKAYWMVFDFGGGTFDAALIRSEDGTMSVVNHGGDNFLGGSDIDWAIVEQLLAPRVAKEFGAPDFRRGVERYRYDLIRLKAAAEAAKIDLSRREATLVEATLRNVAGEMVTFETELTRQDITRVATPIINKAVTIAQRVLSEKDLGAAAVERMIFVGGPTLAPYFRAIVKQRLGVPFDFNVDPLTVVARGAAVFASTQRIAAAPSAKAPLRTNRFGFELLYKPVGAEPDPLVGGRITVPTGGTVVGYSLEVMNQQSKWRSGKITLNESAAFQLNVRAEKGIQNVFVLELRDPTGTLCETEPAEFNYTMGMVVDEQPIINNVGVAMADNRLGVHFTKGQSLPAKSTRTYRTAVGVRRGESGNVLRIPIVEGNRDLADRNILIGSLEITAEKVKRDIPAGCEIEVTFAMDASRMLKVVAYVPLLDEEFPSKIELGGKVRQPDVAMLRAEWARERRRLTTLKENQHLADAQTVQKAIQEHETSALTQEIEAILGHEKAEFDALLRVEREILDWKIRLDEIEDRATWPSLVKEVDVKLTELDTLALQNGTTEEKARSRTLREQVAVLIGEKNAIRLRTKKAEVEDVSSAILFRQTAFWVNHFDALVACQSQMSDAARAQELVLQGRAAAEQENVVALKEVVFGLQDLLPQQALEEVQRGYGSGVLG
jgi:molecular chaperone DnaK